MIKQAWMSVCFHHIPPNPSVMTLSSFDVFPVKDVVASLSMMLWEWLCLDSLGRGAEAGRYGLRDLKVRNGAEIQDFQHLLGVWVDLNDVLFNGGDVRDVVVSPLPLFLLELDGDATDWAGLDALHQVSNKAGDLVAQLLARDDGNLFAYSFVGVEVQGQTGVVLLNDHPGALLDGFCPY